MLLYVVLLLRQRPINDYNAQHTASQRVNWSALDTIQNVAQMATLFIGGICHLICHC